MVKLTQIQDSMRQLLILLFCCSCGTIAKKQIDWVTFYPIYSSQTGENQTVYAYPDDQFVQRLSFVLRHYGDNYAFVNDSIWVEATWYQNEEIVRNYTDKAQDTTWLRQQNYSEL